MTRRTFKTWLVDLLVGGSLGAVAGGIVAVNVAILSGVDRGYEAGVLEVLDHHLLAGLIMILALVLGPIVGVTVLRRRRGRASETAERRIGSHV
jgi:hypothetical protein